MRIVFTIIIFLSLNSISIGQEHRFPFGLTSSIGLSQVDGDNLHGFSKLSYSLGLLGGFKINSGSEIRVRMSLANIGSQSLGSLKSSNSEKYLGEINYTQASLLISYAYSFNEDWDGFKTLRTSAGIQLNQRLSVSSNVVGLLIEDEYELSKDDFRRQYLSFHVSIGRNFTDRISADLEYFHGMQNILTDDEEIRFSKMIPYGISLMVSYYFHR